MRKLIFSLLFLTACVGNSVQTNPLKRSGKKLWWQTNTAAITSNNPWEKFVPQPRVNDDEDPWKNFQEPELFPEGWVPKRLDNPQSRTIIHQDSHGKTY